MKQTYLASLVLSPFHQPCDSTRQKPYAKHQHYRPGRLSRIVMHGLSETDTRYDDSEEREKETCRNHDFGQDAEKHEHVDLEMEIGHIVYTFITFE